MSRGRVAFLLASGGVVCAVALVPAAFLAPVYHGEEGTGRATVELTRTLVGVNGLYVVWLLCIPVFLAFVVWAGLRLRCSRGSVLGGRIAWTAVALVWAFALVGMASVGLFLLPAALLLIVATSLTPAPETTA